MIPIRSTVPKTVAATAASGAAAADLASTVDRAGYLTRLRRLAEECRQTPSVVRHEDSSLSSQLSAEVSALRETAASLALTLEDMKASRALLEARVAVLERSTPYAQVWRDLILSIRSIREAVAQIQEQQQPQHRDRPADSCR